MINAFVDSLLKQVSNPEDITGRGGLLQQLQAKLLNRALEAELTAHFGHEPGEIPDRDKATVETAALLRSFDQVLVR